MGILVHNQCRQLFEVISIFRCRNGFYTHSQHGFCWLFLPRPQWTSKWNNDFRGGHWNAGQWSDHTAFARDLRTFGDIPHDRCYRFSHHTLWHATENSPAEETNASRNDKRK